jgi:hypothetical protein
MRGTKSRKPASPGKLAGKLLRAQKIEAPEQKRAVTKLFWPCLVAPMAISEVRPKRFSFSFPVGYRRSKP